MVGNGYAAYCGDGGAATAACLNAPTAARLDPDGTLIVADDGNQVVRAVSGGGTIGTLIPALFSRVADLWPLAPGQFLYTDTATHTVYRAEPPYTGFTAIAGTGTATGSLDGPGGDPADDLNDGELAWVASLHAPAGLVRDDAGHTFIADSANHRVRRIDALTGVISTVAGTGTAGFNGDGLAGTATELALPYGLAFDDTGDLLVSEREGHRVRRIGARCRRPGDGRSGRDVSPRWPARAWPRSSVTASTRRPLAVHGPTGLAVDVLGHLYVADTGSHAMRTIDRQTGVIQTIAGRGTEGDGVPAVGSQLGAPVHLSAAVHGDTRYLYVTDSQQHRVRRIDLGPGAAAGEPAARGRPARLERSHADRDVAHGCHRRPVRQRFRSGRRPAHLHLVRAVRHRDRLGVAVRLPIGVSTLTVEWTTARATW